MIQGTVTLDCEAVIPVSILGKTGGVERIEALVDTGFNGFVALPRTLISRLKLPCIGLQTEGDPLVGMALLYGFDLHIKVLEGGQVTIRRSSD